MIRLPALAPAAELREVNAALTRAKACPGLHRRAVEILRGRRAALEEILLTNTKVLALVQDKQKAWAGAIPGSPRWFARASRWQVALEVREEGGEDLAPELAQQILGWLEAPLVGRVARTWLAAQLAPLSRCSTCTSTRVTSEGPCRCWHGALAPLCSLLGASWSAAPLYDLMTLVEDKEVRLGVLRTPEQPAMLILRGEGWAYLQAERGAPEPRGRRRELLLSGPDLSSGVAHA